MTYKITIEKLYKDYFDDKTIKLKITEEFIERFKEKIIDQCCLFDSDFCWSRTHYEPLSDMIIELLLNELIQNSSYIRKGKK